MNFLQPLSAKAQQARFIRVQRWNMMYLFYLDSAIVQLFYIRDMSLEPSCLKTLSAYLAY